MENSDQRNDEVTTSHSDHLAIVPKHRENFTPISIITERWI